MDPARDDIDFSRLVDVHVSKQFEAQNRPLEEIRQAMVSIESELKRRAHKSAMDEMLKPTAHWYDKAAKADATGAPSVASPPTEPAPTAARAPPRRAARLGQATTRGRLVGRALANAALDGGAAADAAPASARASAGSPNGGSPRSRGDSKLPKMRSRAVGADRKPRQKADRDPARAQPLRAVPPGPRRLSLLSPASSSSSRAWMTTLRRPSPPPSVPPRLSPPDLVPARQVVYSPSWRSEPAARAADAQQPGLEHVNVTPSPTRVPTRPRTRGTFGG